MSTSESTIASSFPSFSREKLFKQYWPRLRSCVYSVTENRYGGGILTGC
jgi:hypothetical protein